MTTRAPLSYPDAFPGPITLHTLPDLFAHQRARFAGWRMEDDDSGGGDTGGDNNAGGAGGGDTGGSGGNDTGTGGTGGGDAEKRFTQADLDKLIQDRLAKEKSRFDAQLKELQDNAGKSDLEKVTAERDRYKQQAETGGKESAQRLAKAEAKVAALAANGRDDRLGAIIAQADLTDATNDDGDIDETKVRAAIDKVLTDFPEWKRTPGRSGGELNEDRDQKQTYTREQVRTITAGLGNLPPAERDKKLAELNRAMAEGRVSS